jgi:ubiquinone/menaquinone biosynthesis C-methylase UbiE
MPNLTDPARAWSNVAQAWDANADELDGHSAPATAALQKRAAVRPGDRVLELGAGTGRLGSSWSSLTGPAGTVILSDIAPGMVDVARRRNAHLPNVAVMVLDACAIDRPDASADVVACLMGLQFTPDPAVAFAEIRRVLAAGGRLAALTWAAMEHNPWMTCVGMAAMVNGLVAGGPPAGPGTIFSLGDPADLENMAKDSGFVDVRVEEVPMTFAADSIDTHVNRVLALAPQVAPAVAAAPPEKLNAVRRTAADLAAAYHTDDGVRIPGRALLISART